MADIKSLASAASDAHAAYLTAQSSADAAYATWQTDQATADAAQTAQHAAFAALLTEITGEDVTEPKGGQTPPPALAGTQS